MRSVLYVDDEDALLDITRIFLERDGEIQVETCSDPQVALERLEAKKYDVVVTDYEMPLLNGIELLKAIKARGIDVPIILFTGRGRELVAIEALNNGAAFYLQKGGDPKSQFAELKNMIRRATEHKLVEHRLKLTQFSVERAADEVFWIDRSGKFLYVNKAASISKGYTQDELLARSVFDVNPTYTQETWRDRFEENKQKGSLKYVSTHRRKDGSIFPVEISSNYLTYDGNEYFFAFARDISRRRQNEMELRKSIDALNENAARMETLIRIAARLNSTLNPDEVMKAVCEETARALQAQLATLYLYDPAQQGFIAGSDYRTVSELPRIRSFIPLAVYQSLSRGTQKVIVIPDAQECPELLQFQDVIQAGVKTVMSVVLERKGALLGILAVTTLGETRVFTDDDISLLQGIADETALAITTARLFTEHKKNEDAVVQANKKLNLLSNITRHDILNKLTVLRAYLDLMKEKIADPHLSMYIQAQENAAAAIENQIEFTRMYEDLGVRHPEWQDIGLAIRQIKSQVDLHTIRLEVEIQDVFVYGDTLIEKVFYNLIDNAVRYGETITRITFSCEQRQDEFIIVCEDDGLGIPDKDKVRIFERGIGKNTGLGLFLAREILSITGMTIAETGTYGKGARFEISVPKKNVRIGSA